MLRVHVFGVGLKILQSLLLLQGFSLRVSLAYRCRTLSMMALAIWNFFLMIVSWHELWMRPIDMPNSVNNKTAGRSPIPTDGNLLLWTTCGCFLEFSYYRVLLVSLSSNGIGQLINCWKRQFFVKLWLCVVSHWKWNTCTSQTMTSMMRQLIPTPNSIKCGMYMTWSEIISRMCMFLIKISVPMRA